MTDTDPALIFQLTVTENADPDLLLGNRFNAASDEELDLLVMGAGQRLIEIGEALVYGTREEEEDLGH